MTLSVRLVAAILALITVGLLAAVLWQQAVAGDNPCGRGAAVYVPGDVQCRPASQWRSEP